MLQTRHQRTSGDTAKTTTNCQLAPALCTWVRRSNSQYQQVAVVCNRYSLRWSGRPGTADIQTCFRWPCRYDHLVALCSDEMVMKNEILPRVPAWLCSLLLLLMCRDVLRWRAYKSALLGLGLTNVAPLPMGGESPALTVQHAELGKDVSPASASGSGHTAKARMEVLMLSCLRTYETWEMHI